MNFLERVYGIDNEAIFVDLLERCFLPDIRAATILDLVIVDDCTYY